MELTVLDPPHPIDRFVQVFSDMKLVMHDLGLGCCLSSRTQVRLPHIDTDRFNLMTLLAPELGPEFLAGLSRPVGTTSKTRLCSKSLIRLT